MNPCCTTDNGFMLNVFAGCPSNLYWDSILNNSADYNYPETRVHCLLGDMDDTWSATHGYLYWRQVQDPNKAPQAGEKVIAFVPGAGHVLHHSVVGEEEGCEGEPCTEEECQAENENVGADAVVRAVLAAKNDCAGTLSALKWPNTTNVAGSNALEFRVTGTPDQIFGIVIGSRSEIPMSPDPTYGWFFIDTSSFYTIPWGGCLDANGEATVSTTVGPGIDGKLPFQAVIGTAVFCSTNMVQVVFNT
jgi:hypothetical protein